MTCDRCQRPFSYSYYIDNEFWLRANGGVKEGHICAHCILQDLGGVDWHIVFSEPMAVVAQREDDYLPKGVKASWPTKRKILGDRAAGDEK